jgi:hypothetical protein
MEVMRLQSSAYSLELGVQDAAVRVGKRHQSPGLLSRHSDLSRSVRSFHASGGRQPSQSISSQVDAVGNLPSAQNISSIGIGMPRRWDNALVTARAVGSDGLTFPAIRRETVAREMDASSARRAGPSQP